MDEVRLAKAKEAAHIIQFAANAAHISGLERMWLYTMALQMTFREVNDNAGR